MLFAVSLQNYTSLEASNNCARYTFTTNEIKAGLKTDFNLKIDVKKPTPEKKEQNQNNSFDFTGEDNIEWLHLYLPAAFNLCFAPLNSRFFFFYKEKYSEQFHSDIVPPTPKA